MKALVLAGGRGSRINEISHIQNKCMIRLLGKPVLQYNLDILAGLEVSEIIVVVGYKPEEIINEYGNRFAGKKIRFAPDYEPVSRPPPVKEAALPPASVPATPRAGKELAVGRSVDELLSPL